MENKEAIIIGGSAGSIDSLMEILSALSKDACLPLIVILHRKSAIENRLEDLLQLKTNFEVIEVEDKMQIENNKIYLAPANYHLLIESNRTFSLDYSEKVNYSRPNIDVSMKSAAEVFRGKTVGILLSGANCDGTEGLRAIKDAGGIAIIQSPETCLFPEMTIHAEQQFETDHKLSPDKIAEYISNI